MPKAMVQEIPVDRVEIFVLLNDILLDSFSLLFPQGAFPTKVLDYTMFATCASAVLSYKAMIQEVFRYEIQTTNIKVFSNKAIAPVRNTQTRDRLAGICHYVSLIDVGFPADFERVFVNGATRITVKNLETTVAHAYRVLGLGFIECEKSRLQMIVGDHSTPETKTLVKFIVRPLRYLRWKQQVRSLPDNPGHEMVPTILRELPNGETLLEDFKDVYNGPNQFSA